MIYSKSNKNGGTALVDHTKMVINVSVETVKKNFDSVTIETLKKLVIAAILHDIGKASSSFQRFLEKRNQLDEEGLEGGTTSNNKEGDFYYHNTISWAFAVSCLSGLTKKKYQSIRSAVLYHHTMRDDPEMTAGTIMSELFQNDSFGFGKMVEIYKEAVQYADEKFNLGLSDDSDFSVLEINSSDDFSYLFHLKDELLYPKYDKNNQASSMEASFESALIMSTIVYADRTVSSEEYDNNLILNADASYINSIYDSRVCVNYNKEPDFSQYDGVRLEKQKNIVKQICEGHNGVWEVSASAGFGKTIMGLCYHFSERKKTMWVVPRVFIAESTYNSILSELRTMNMYDTVKVGLFYGGDFKDCNFGDVTQVNPLDCDILVLVVDTFLSRYSKNSLSSLLIDSYLGNVIFDEYHEFVCPQPLFAAFVNMVYTRKHHTHTKTLLLSATGHDLSNLWFDDGTNNSYEKITPDIYGGDTVVNVHFTRIEIIDEMQADANENSFTIMPTVRTSQELYQRTRGRNELLIHAWFSPEDRDRIEGTLYELYGKHSLRDVKLPIIATNIIGVGLDISAASITQCMPTPEGTIQVGCGRGSRFNEYQQIDYNVVATKDWGINKFLKTLYDGDLLHMWVDVLESLDGKSVTKTELYHLRDTFYKKNQRKMQRYIVDRYEKSAESLSKIRHKSGIHYNVSDYDMCTSGLTYRGESDSFYATVLSEGKYIKPLVCDARVLSNEEDSTRCNKLRYEFMWVDTSPYGFNTSFPNKYALKRGYGIKQKNEATVAKCFAMARRSDRPMLLLNYSYTSELGLYLTNNTNQNEED